MKPGDIVKIKGRVPMTVIRDYSGCMHKANCPMWEDCPVKEEKQMCLHPFSLQYGKWYKCSEVMPEDMMGAREIGTCEIIGSLAVGTKDGNLLLACRSCDTSNNWGWGDSSVAMYANDFTHWMAIPPIPKE